MGLSVDDLVVSSCECGCLFIYFCPLGQTKRGRETENVAESGLDCAGHRGHSHLRAALHALR